MKPPGDRVSDPTPEVRAGVRRLHEAARQLIFDLGAVWSPEERARVLWAAVRGEPTTVSITLAPEIAVAVWVGDIPVAVIPCTSKAPSNERASLHPVRGRDPTVRSTRTAAHTVPAGPG